MKREKLRLMKSSWRTNLIEFPSSGRICWIIRNNQFTDTQKEIKMLLMAPQIRQTDTRILLFLRLASKWVKITFFRWETASRLFPSARHCFKDLSCVCVCAMFCGPALIPADWMLFFCFVKQRDLLPREVAYSPELSFPLLLDAWYYRLTSWT